ncbi:MAG TPA: hypothetical protein VFP63_05820 [Dehalococcoidia bacterium]|nr:hypothetical protein [Dehalococcoidia bacterium]
MTRPASLVSVSVRGAAAAAALLLVVLVLACGDAEEEIAPDTPSPTSDASTSATPAPTTTAPTSTPSLPEDWATYSNSSAGFTFRYPSAWFAVAEGGVYSWDVSSTQTVRRPPDGITVQVLSGPIDQAEQRPSDATDTNLAGLAAWEYARTEGPDLSGDIARVHVIATDLNGTRFFLVGAFGPANIDESTFAMIASSFEFAPAAQ